MTDETIVASYDISAHAGLVAADLVGKVVR